MMTYKVALANCEVSTSNCPWIPLVGEELYCVGIQNIHDRSREALWLFLWFSSYSLLFPIGLDNPSEHCKVPCAWLST